MLKDITLGQYYPGKSVVHKLDPRIKIILTVLYIVMLFCASNPIGLAVGITFMLLSYALSRLIPFFRLAIVHLIAIISSFNNVVILDPPNY